MEQSMTSTTKGKSRSFKECHLYVLKGECSLAMEDIGRCVVEAEQEDDTKTCSVQIQCESEFSPSFQVSGDTNHCPVGRLGYQVDLPQYCCSVIITFQQREEVAAFKSMLLSATEKLPTKSMFSERTEEESAKLYFQSYGHISQQQNMLQDHIRTSTYQKAMLRNKVDFEDKVVIDLGAGSGILSFFAVQAGARKVYAIEASSMAKHAELLIKKNNLEGKIILVPGKVEEVHIPEEVDMVISEPMGYMLYNERMLESYLHAKKWLKPGGNMFPTRGDLFAAPFSDDALYTELSTKANFWQQQSFYGVDLSSLQNAATKEYFSQPVKDTFDVRVLMAEPITHTIDFLESEEDDLHKIDIPVKFSLLTSGSLHGLAFWFDVVFQGSQECVRLSTAPHEPLTHWYQIRCLLETPIAVQAGQILRGTVLLISNARQSYDVELDLGLEGTPIRSKNTVDLKNPYFRYTSVHSQPDAEKLNQDGIAGYAGGHNPCWSAGNFINIPSLPPTTLSSGLSGDSSNTNAGPTSSKKMKPATNGSQ